MRSSASRWRASSGTPFTAGCAAQGNLGGSHRAPRGRGGEVDGRPAERSCVKKRNNFLEQVRKAQEAAKTKPQTGASKSATEMIDAELRTGGVGFVCTTFFRIPRLCNRTLT